MTTPVERKCQKLLDKMNAKKWFRCPKCREEFDALRSSGLCVFCDPIKSTTTAKKKPEEKVDKVLNDLGIDAKTKAAGDAV